ncbi:MAG TPA: pyrimidine-nucleoside phosphorylase [Pseudogracilibacillus sp.]|nr:pyrimidine-nucleoside phosphorylase [Pseudogracilibacillus sp.]
MRMYDIIEKKRDGYALTKEEIRFFVDSYTDGKIPDYQVSALLMAIYFQGMTDEESAALTMAMAHSGVWLDLSEIAGTKVDKHSTGGVGDTTTLILIPLVASIGVPIPKMSGRGLGHTGGTIDKLESIAGFHVEISEARFKQLVNENGLSIIGQSEQLAPADKLLYSLRDVTATVNSIPLIASSIMSKKIASGADKIVLDVKLGQGAFMKQLPDAQALARTMVGIGNKVGKETVALITNMDQPLGRAIGNALEVKEAIATLKGQGPSDITELVIKLGAHMAVLGEKAKDIPHAEALLRENIKNGKAIEYFSRFVEAQGGNVAVIDQVDLLPQAAYTYDLTAKTSGYISELVAHELGRAAMLLGAGRRSKEDEIDLAVGLYLHKKVGDQVEAGDMLCTIYANDEDVSDIQRLIEKNIVISNEQVKPTLLLDLIK